MKGESSLTKKPIHRVFKALGALICLRMEAEWKRKGERRNPLYGQLFSNLGDADDGFDSPSNTWTRWRNFASASAFASGRLDVAIAIINWAESQSLLTTDLATEIQNVLQSLQHIGNGGFAADHEESDALISRGDQLVFTLASVDYTLSDDSLLDLENNGQEISKQAAEAAFKIVKGKQGHPRTRIIWTAFEALDALTELQENIMQAIDILECSLSPPQTRRPIATSTLARALAIEVIAQELDGLVQRILYLMQEIHGPGQYSLEKAQSVASELLKRAKYKIHHLN